MRFCVINADSLFIEIFPTKILIVKLKQIFLPLTQLPMIQHSKLRSNRRKLFLRLSTLKFLSRGQLLLIKYCCIYFSMKNLTVIPQWAHDIRNVYVTFYKRSRNIPMSNVRKTFLEPFWNVFRTLDIGMFLKRL